MAENYIDQTPFLSDKFDVNAYANAVLAGRTYRPEEEESNQAGPSSRPMNGGIPTGKGDIGAELAKLNHGIEDVTKHLRQEINASYPLLLSHLTSSLALSSQLKPIKASLNSLSTSLDRINTKIHDPYENLSILVKRQQLLGLVSDLTRRAARFVLLARRMEGQMSRMKNARADKIGEGEKERELAKAALSVAELDSLLHPPHSSSKGENGMSNAESGEGGNIGAEVIPLDELNFVKQYAPKVDNARDTIIQEMEGMVINGLSELNQPLLSSSLQTAHNLRLLPDLVSNLLADLNDAVTLRITRAFDPAAIGREVTSKDGQQGSKYTSRIRQSLEPNSSNAAQWTAVLWSRLDRVMDDVANCCIKVYTLEKVLKMKRDNHLQMEFLQVVMNKLEEKPSFIFWTTLAKAFETQTREAAKSSTWMQQSLSTGYPRLLRLFHDFFQKISVHTDTIYTKDQQSPETVLILRSISTFETLYLSRSTTRMNEIVNSAVSAGLGNSGMGRGGSVPGPGDGVTIARTITNELDSARFDPLLVRTVARNAVRVLDGLIAKVDGLLIRDFTSTSLIGSSATAAQNVNSALSGFLYHLWYNLLFVETEFPPKVWEIMQTTIKSIQATYRKITEPLNAAFRKEFSSIISRIHKVDFNKAMDPMSMGQGGGSPYMQDFSDKIGFIKAEILGKMNMGDFMKEWTIQLSKFSIRTFLLHASIVRPLGESGKLKLTTDMTELEMNLASLLSTGQVQGQRGGTRVDKIGEEYLALRSFRQLLFSPPSSLTNFVETVHLPPLIVLHHIIVLSPLELPHKVKNWSEAEYFNWTQNHKEEESWDLLETTVNGQIDKKAEGEREKDVFDEGPTETELKVTVPKGQPTSKEEWVGLIQEVLITARTNEDD